MSEVSDQCTTTLTDLPFDLLYLIGIPPQCTGKQYAHEYTILTSDSNIEKVNLLDQKIKEYLKNLNKYNQELLDLKIKNFSTTLCKFDDFYISIYKGYSFIEIRALTDTSNNISKYIIEYFCNHNEIEKTSLKKVVKDIQKTKFLKLALGAFIYQTQEKGKIKVEVKPRYYNTSHKLMDFMNKTFMNKELTAENSNLENFLSGDKIQQFVEFGKALFQDCTEMEVELVNIFNNEQSGGKKTKKDSITWTSKGKRVINGKERHVYSKNNGKTMFIKKKENGKMIYVKI